MQTLSEIIARRPSDSRQWLGWIGEVRAAREAEDRARHDAFMAGLAALSDRVTEFYRHGL